MTRRVQPPCPSGDRIATPLATDAARYLFDVHLRQVADPEDTALLRVLAGITSRVTWRLSGPYRQVMASELRRSFSSLQHSERALHRVVRTAWDLYTQCRVEELVLPALDSGLVQRWARFDGRTHLDAALEAGHGAILVHLTGGNVPLALTLLTRTGYRCAAQLATELAPASWLGRRAHAVRVGAWSRIGAHVAGVDDPEPLEAAVRAGGIAMLALDAREGDARDGTLLGRPARLSAAAWELAERTGAPVLPVMAIRARNREHHLRIGPVVGGVDAALRDHLEPWLRERPDHYGRTLLLRRMDPIPLFRD